MRILILLLILALSGCASAIKGMSPDEIEYYHDNRDAVDKGNWTNCQIVYRQSHMPTWHIGHTHTSQRKNVQIERWDRRDDLITNRCKQVLNDEVWQTY